MSNSVNLLTSWTPFHYTQKEVRESREINGGKIVLKGVIQRADVLNQNGRVYPRAILEREVRNYQKLIQERRSLGEIDHPAESVVNYKNVALLITEAYMTADGSVMGTIELLDTPGGKILQTLVEAGVTLGISSRGVGSTKRQGDRDIVQDDLVIVAWDAVQDPSTIGAFLFKESREVRPSELSQVLTKSDRVDRIFNDVLNWNRN